MYEKVSHLPTLIEEVKFEFIKSARKKELESDKQLFTMDEYLETFANENFKAQKFFKDDNDFFENLLEKSATKHYNHLRFLSSKHKANLQNCGLFINHFHLYFF